MADRRTQIIAELETNLDDTVAFFRSLAPGALERQVYPDGARWSVRQVLAHFFTIERSMQWLFKDILAGGPGAPPDFDLERFNRSQPKKWDGQSLDALIEQFTSVRRDTIAIVEQMSDPDLDREGRHAFHGHGNLGRFIRWAYEHVQQHLEDIRQIMPEK